MARICEGSDRAFNVLIDRHQQAVRGFLRRILANAAEADDIAQETFLAAWQGASRYRQGASVRSWLCAIAWRKAKGAQRTWFQRRARETRYQAQAPGEDNTGASVEDCISLKLALLALPVDQRAAIALCLAEEFSHSEAADILGMPLGTVKSHTARGKARLLAALDDRNESLLESSRGGDW